MNEILKKIGLCGIIPVIRIDDPDTAVPLARALSDGGIPCAEITFRTQHGEEAIRRVAEAMPDVLLGAGTILTPGQADRAIEAGAGFIVSPGLNPRVVEHCLQKDVPITPGCSNPSDIETALEMGLETVKFFPAEQAGGLGYIKALSGPYPSVRFIPTGGINAENIAKYMSFDRVLACGGSWMVPTALVNAGKFDEITALCREAVDLMLGFTPAHIGINAENEEVAVNAASMFEALFGFPKKAGHSSVFAGGYVEVMKSPYLGRHGHIAIAVSSIERAMAHLERRGVVFMPESAKKNAAGTLHAIYLKDEIAGFAVHLMRK